MGAIPFQKREISRLWEKGKVNINQHKKRADKLFKHDHPRMDLISFANGRWCLQIQRFALFFDERKLLKTKTLALTSIEEFQLTRAREAVFLSEAKLSFFL